MANRVLLLLCHLAVVLPTAKAFWSSTDGERFTSNGGTSIRQDHNGVADQSGFRVSSDRIATDQLSESSGSIGDTRQLLRRDVFQELTPPNTSKTGLACKLKCKEVTSYKWNQKCKWSTCAGCGPCADEEIIDVTQKVVGVGTNEAFTKDTQDSAEVKEEIENEFADAVGNQDKEEEDEKIQAHSIGSDMDDPKTVESPPADKHAKRNSTAATGVLLWPYVSFGLLLVVGGIVFGFALGDPESKERKCEEQLHREKNPGEVKKRPASKMPGRFLKKGEEKPVPVEQESQPLASPETEELAGEEPAGEEPALLEEGDDLPISDESVQALRESDPTLDPSSTSGIDTGLSGAPPATENPATTSST